MDDRSYVRKEMINTTAYNRQKIYYEPEGNNLAQRQTKSHQSSQIKIKNIQVPDKSSQGQINLK